MTKRLAAKTGTYTNQQGEQKGEYTQIGVLMSGDNGEYMLLDPTVNLAGVLAKQNAMAFNDGKPMRTSVMVSVFANENQQQQQQQQHQGGYQQPHQPAQQRAPQQQPQQQYNSHPQNYGQQQYNTPPVDFDEEIPF